MRVPDIHAARVYLAMARHYRKRGDRFAVTLLEWAGNARRRAMAQRKQARALMQQEELFT